MNPWKFLLSSALLATFAVQPGFVSRESAHGAGGEWLVIVHWRSAKDADASMASFEKAAAAAQFMSKIEASTMSMKRYER